jgi:hypothetical protein
VALTARLDAATARANGLEVLNAEQSSRLADVQAVSNSAERRSESLQVSLDRALERVRILELSDEEARQKQATMEVARLAAVERAEALTKVGVPSVRKATAVTAPSSWVSVARVWSDFRWCKRIRPSLGTWTKRKKQNWLQKEIRLCTSNKVF